MKQAAITYYACDPAKNTACKKRHCKLITPNDPLAFCDATTNPAFARSDEHGEPMVKEQITRYAEETEPGRPDRAGGK